MISFGEQLYRLVGPKDNFTQPLELVTIARGPETFTGAVGSTVITSQLFTSPADRVTFITGYGAMLIPDNATSALGLALQAQLLNGGLAILHATALGFSAPSGGPQFRLGTDCNVILPGGSSIQLVGEFSAPATVGHSMLGVFIQGWSVPRGSISFR